jgi:hypothetical protein
MGGPNEAPEAPIDPKTGEPVGIDKGFGYNVGQAAWGEGEAKAKIEEKGRWRDLVPWGPEKYGRPETLPSDEPKARIAPQSVSGDVAALRQVFKKAVGSDSTFIEDPKGEPVNANEALPDEIAKRAIGQPGIEAYFPFIRELIEAPYEVWVNFAKNDLSGRVALFRRYVKAIRLGEETMNLWAEVRDGFLVNFKAGEQLESVRKGRLIYGR